MNSCQKHGPFQGFWFYQRLEQIRGQPMIKSGASGANLSKSGTSTWANQGLVEQIRGQAAATNSLILVYQGSRNQDIPGYCFRLTGLLACWECWNAIGFVRVWCCFVGFSYCKTRVNKMGFPFPGASGARQPEPESHQTITKPIAFQYCSQSHYKTKCISTFPEQLEPGALPVALARNLWFPGALGASQPEQENHQTIIKPSAFQYCS